MAKADVQTGDAGTGTVKAAEVRGYRKSRRGYVTSDKMDKTVVVEVEDRVKHPLYGKVIRRTSKVKAHDEVNAAGIGDLGALGAFGALSGNALNERLGSGRRRRLPRHTPRNAAARAAAASAAAATAARGARGKDGGGEAEGGGSAHLHAATDDARAAVVDPGRDI
jgi:small subunit ribosomal protein S17